MLLEWLGPRLIGLFGAGVMKLRQLAQQSMAPPERSRAGPFRRGEKLETSVAPACARVAGLDALPYPTPSRFRARPRVQRPSRRQLVRPGGIGCRLRARDVRPDHGRKALPNSRSLPRIKGQRGETRLLRGSDAISAPCLTSLELINTSPPLNQPPTTPL